MFKRSLAPVAAVAVVSGAVVAPANAITVKFNNDNMTCTIEQNDEEANLTKVKEDVNDPSGTSCSDQSEHRRTPAVCPSRGDREG